MTIGVTGRGDRHGTVSERWAVAIGAATIVMAVTTGMALQAWAQGPPPRHDMFEPFLDPWSGLTWITMLALWIATITRDWPWRPTLGICLLFLAIQAWMVVRAAWIGLQDGQVGGPGALAGGLSITQIGLTVVWIALIARSKRMRT